MKRFLTYFLFFLITTHISAQEFKTHKVKEGETIEKIASTYLVTPFDLLALNPDAKAELKPGTVLIIPKSKVLDNPVEVEEVKLLGYKSHKVKRKETLYSISKQYNISIEDIKKYNTRLYSENLRKGDKINIPNFGSVKTTSNLENTIRKYQVLPKEGKWRVAYKFGISIAELESLNPDLGELQVNQIINVPNIANNEERNVDENYGYYTVLPKEGFYRLNIKLGLTKEELEDLNPELIDGGLKVGMILKVPMEAGNIYGLSEEIESTSLISKISNFEPKRLAVILPFRLHRIDFDSIEETKEYIKQDRSLAISLDFHTGVLMAIDSARRLGISTKLDVFDSKARASEVSSILQQNNFDEYDAVIGPLTAESFDRMANALNDYNVPAISPVTQPKKLYNNVFQTIPPDELLRERIIAYVKRDTAFHGNMMIISDGKHRTVSNQIKSHFPLAKQIFSRVDEEGNDGFYIVKEDVEELFEEGRTVVFLETANEGFVSNVTSMLNAYNGTELLDDETEIEREIILITTNKNRAFESTNISNYNLSDLKFHYPSANRVYDYETPNKFVNLYISVYGAAPNKYAVRGFDLTMDVLLRLSTEEGLYGLTEQDFETSYVENRFRYVKKMFGGYYNEGFYINKYDDLKIVVVQEPHQQ
jgi:LysM repeat protein